MDKKVNFHERLLKRAEELAGIGHWHIDIENNSKIFWSDTIFTIHGLDKKNGVPNMQDAINAYHPDDRHYVLSLVDKAVSDGKSFSFESRLVRPCGEIRFVKSFGECEKNEDGDVIALFGVFNDITDFKLREQEAQKSKADLARLIENIPDVVFVKDANLKIIMANSAFLSLYPEDVRDKIIGTTTVENYPKDQAEEFLKNDRSALAKGYNEVIEKIDFPNGDTKILFTKKVGYRDDDGTHFLLGISRDLTDIKNTEDELIRSNMELERFAYIASHDLQEPLRMVTSFTDLLKAEYHDKLDDTGKQYIAFSQDAAKHMKILISDLLEYSKLGFQQERNQDVNTQKSLAIAIEQLSDTIKNKQAVITYDQLPNIHANPLKITQLFQNLLSNAMKYINTGVKPTVHVSCEDNGDYYIFSVKDNGIGIKPEYKDKIFNIFERLHGKNEYEGTGIGLAICYKVVNLLGGNIWIESEEGMGTTFKFSIPKQKGNTK